MDIQHLIKLANNIASFFESEPDRAKGAQEIANHLKSFWEPRMRRQILAHLDEQNGKGLNKLALTALQDYRKELTPQV
jgi:formate dehydrogenase subunit delta